MIEGEGEQFELKTLSAGAVEAAIQRATRYRVLNQPEAAASICRDVLAVSPDHHEATITLLLTLTDQFRRGLAGRFDEACRIAAGLPDSYEKKYYQGLILERRGKAAYRSQSPGNGFLCYDWLRQAMEAFEEAEAQRPPGNDEALFRWNHCARVIMDHSDIRPRPPEAAPTITGE